MCKLNFENKLIRFDPATFPNSACITDGADGAEHETAANAKLATLHRHVARGLTHERIPLAEPGIERRAAPTRLFPWERPERGRGRGRGQGSTRGEIPRGVESRYAMHTRTFLQPKMAADDHPAAINASFPFAGRDCDAGGRRRAPARHLGQHVRSQQLEARKEGQAAGPS